MIGEKPVRRTRITVVKVTGGNDVELVVRSRDAVTFRVHWLGKRSFMCPADDCPACVQFVGSKWLGLLAVDVILSGGRKPWLGLLEVTESAYEGLRFLRETEGLESFHGLHFQVSRRHRRAVMNFTLLDKGDWNGEVRREVSMNAVADGAATLFNLPAVGPLESLSSWEERALEAARALIGRAVVRQSNQPC